MQVFSGRVTPALGFALPARRTRHLQPTFATVSANSGHHPPLVEALITPDGSENAKEIFAEDAARFGLAEAARPERGRNVTRLFVAGDAARPNPRRLRDVALVVSEIDVVLLVLVREVETESDMRRADKIRDIRGMID